MGTIEMILGITGTVSGIISLTLAYVLWYKFGRISKLDVDPKEFGKIIATVKIFSKTFKENIKKNREDNNRHTIRSWCTL